MENSLSPAFVRINYTTAFGVHSMTVPTVPVFLDGATWKFTLRDEVTPTSVLTEITAYVNLLKVFFNATTTFVDFILYVQDSPATTPVPFYSATLAIVGTSGATAWAKAVQRTWTFRADDFGLFKLVMLDVPNDGFDRVTATQAGAQTSLKNYIIGANTPIAARSGGKPTVFLQFVDTLNDKLRKAYRMN